MQVPKWFIDLIEEIKRRHGTDDALAKLVVEVGRDARRKYVEGGRDYREELRKAIASRSNPRKIEDLWRKFGRKG